MSSATTPAATATATAVVVIPIDDLVSLECFALLCMELLRTRIHYMAVGGVDLFH